MNVIVDQVTCPKISFTLTYKKSNMSLSNVHVFVLDFLSFDISMYKYLIMFLVSWNVPLILWIWRVEILLLSIEFLICDLFVFEGVNVIWWIYFNEICKLARFLRLRQSTLSKRTLIFFMKKVFYCFLSWCWISTYLYHNYRLNSNFQQ